jgi:hypothetical protein
MKPLNLVALTVLAAAVVSGCGPKWLTPDEQARICRVAIEEAPDAFAYEPNPFFDVVGGPVRGAATGAGVAALGILNPLFLPVALMAVGGGMACGESARLHPHAQTDFQRIVADADRTALRKTLVADLDAGLAGCRAGRTPTPAAPIDAVIRIEKFEVGMVCPLELFEYRSTVKWRALAVPGDRLLHEETTTCRFLSTKAVDEWATDAGRARSEFERALSRTGHAIAAVFLPEKTGPRGCREDFGSATSQ